MFNTSGDPVQQHPPLHTYRLVLAYDGTDFFGWQVQPRLQTIQGTLAEAVRKVTGESVLPQGSGRTDAGVHAEGQVVSLNLRNLVPPQRLCRALNHRLPAAIRVVSAAEAAVDFHARACVAHKTYEYRIFERRVAGGEGERTCPPPVARFAWDCRWQLCLERLQQAAAELAGTHNFTSFAATDPDRARRQLSPAAAADTTRTIYRSCWQREGKFLRYRVTGSGFLHHMVRTIVGTCVEIGTGRLPADAMPDILRARDRRRAGATAPPQGLHLMQVVYDGDRDAELFAEPGRGVA